MDLLFYYLVVSWVTVFLFVIFSDVFPKWLNYTLIALTPLFILIIVEVIYRKIIKRERKDKIPENTIRVKIKKDVKLYDN